MGNGRDNGGFGDMNYSFFYGFNFFFCCLSILCLSFGGVDFCRDWVCFLSLWEMEQVMEQCGFELKDFFF